MGYGALVVRSWGATRERRAAGARCSRGRARRRRRAGPVARRRFLLFASCNDTRLLVSSVPSYCRLHVRREIARDRLHEIFPLCEADCDRPIVPMPGWASLTLLNAALASMEVGFCDDNGDGFYMQQPANHLERWQLPRDNGTHLLIQWKIDRRMANRNVSSYMADVKTSVPVLNLFVGTFGGFPQDICAAEGSKARNAVKTHEAVRHPTCSPYAWDAASVQRSTSFEIPDALRLMASWDVSVVVRAYGSHAPIGQPEAAVPCVWWCHTYRRRREVDMKPSGAAGARGRRRLPRWMHNVWRILRRSAVDKGREL
jgi:hypothetical protein